MTQVKALDASAYSGIGSVDPLKWRDAYTAGYRLVVIQAWGGKPVGMGPNQYAEQQLRAARVAGFITAAYVWLPSDDTTDTSALMRLAKEACGTEWEHITFVAMDLEGSRLHPVNPDARLADAISHVIGEKSVKIYCSLNSWRVVMQDSKTFFRFGLWQAHYDGDDRLDVPPALPNGGWTQRQMKQYQGTSNVAGLVVDLNVADLDRLGIKPEETDPCATVRAQLHRVTQERDTLAAQIQRARELAEALTRELRAP